MNSTDTSNHTTPASSSGDHNQPGTWLATLLPLLRYLNTRTLALLMFVGFAFLNTSHGKDAQTDKPAVGVTNTAAGDNGHQGDWATEASILWQLAGQIVHAFTTAQNDPSLIEYAKQQGTDTGDLQKTPCQRATSKTSTY